MSIENLARVVGIEPTLLRGYRLTVGRITTLPHPSEVFYVGGDDGNRTHHTRFAKRRRLPLEHAPPNAVLQGADRKLPYLSHFPNTGRVSETWWTVGGSNSRPPACKASALPTELTARIQWCSST